MDIDDSGHKVAQLENILNKQRQFFENVHQVVRSQTAEVRNALKKVAEFSLFLEKNRVEDEFENQVAPLMSVSLVLVVSEIHVDFQGGPRCGNRVSF